MDWQRALTPGFKLLGERLIETTDRTGTGSDPHQRLGHFSYFVGARSGHEHLRQSFGDVRFKATVAFKGLRVELTFTISGHFHLLQPTRRCHQVSRVRAVAIAFALGTAFSPLGSNEGI